MAERRPFMSIEDAYRHDPAFHAVVDMIEMMIQRAEITPAEARGAAVLACIHYELHNMRSFRIPFPEGAHGALNSIQQASHRIDMLVRWVNEVERKDADG